MFKKDYKSAMDCIDTNDAQSRVISAVAKGRKRKTPYYTYIAATAAAVICIFTAVIALRPSSEISGTAVLSNTPIEKKAVSANEDSNTPEIEIPENTADYTPVPDFNNTSAETDIITQSPQQNEKSTTTQKNEALYIMMDVNYINPKVTRSVSVPMMTAETVADSSVTPELSDEKAISSGSGSGGSYMANTPVAIPEISFSSYEQYCEYSGTDISGKINLPSGMSANEFTGVPLNSDGEIENADYTFSFSGNGKELSVTLTEGAFAESYLSDEAYKKSIFGESEAVITRTESYCNAYFMLGGFSYDVQGYNITDDELKDIVLSLIN